MLQANAIRMLAAVIFIWALTAFECRAGGTLVVLREDPKVLGLLALGVSASLLAVQHAEIGKPTSLMA